MPDRADLCDRGVDDPLLPLISDLRRAEQRRDAMLDLAALRAAPSRPARPGWKSVAGSATALRRSLRADAPVGSARVPEQSGLQFLTGSVGNERPSWSSKPPGFPWRRSGVGPYITTSSR